MIDIHCHILPGIDDGPSDMEESLTMARQAIADGIHTIVATPHTFNEVYNNSASEVMAHVDNLREIFSENRLDLDLCPGSDAHICVNMTERILERVL